jgi:microcystin-dependent protein
VAVADSSWMTPGLLVYITGAGTFTVIGSPPSPSSVVLANSCDPANAAAGTLISGGIQISPAALRGPQGNQGIPGPSGPPGPQGVGGVSVYTTLAQSFTVPPVGSSATAFVTVADAFSVGLIVYVAGIGYYNVSAVSVPNKTLTLVNQGYPGDQPPGTVAPAGSTVSGTGPAGVAGPAGPAGPPGIQGPVGLAPTGAIFLWAAASAPGGYLLCDGTAYSTTGYSALFSIISTAYNTAGGASDPGPGMFRVPNFQGRVPLGAGQSNAPGATSHALASTGGEETHLMAVTEMAAHGHDLTVSAYDTGHAHVVPAHGHGWNDNNHANLVPVHGHGLNWSDLGHHHNMHVSGAGSGSAGNLLNSASGNTSEVTTTVGTGIGASVANAAAFWTGGVNVAVGSVANAGAFWDQTNYAAIIASGTANNTGGGTAFNELPPYLTVNYVIKT